MAVEGGGASTEFRPARGGGVEPVSKPVAGRRLFITSEMFGDGRWFKCAIWMPRCDWEEKGRSPLPFRRLGNDIPDAGGR